MLNAQDAAVSFHALEFGDTELIRRDGPWNIQTVRATGVMYESFPCRIAQMSRELAGIGNTAETLCALVKYARALLMCDEAAATALERACSTEPGKTATQSGCPTDEPGRACSGSPRDEVIHGNDFYFVWDTAKSDLWPEWSTAVAELGYGSVMVLPLQTREGYRALLNLFSRQKYGFGGLEVDQALVFAKTAIVALGAAEQKNAATVPQAAS